LREHIPPDVFWGFNYEDDRAWVWAEARIDIHALVAEALAQTLALVGGAPHRLPCPLPGRAVQSRITGGHKRTWDPVRSCVNLSDPRSSPWSTR
jgi:hypothetical protein